MNPEAAMKIALGAARRATGRTYPNPPVGAAVFRGNQVLGRGATRPVGGPHAEIVAFENAKRRHGARSLRGASLAVTLEPCCRVGRTGPCTDAIIAAGIRRVFVGHCDPHPDVSGAGVRRLRRAGVEVRLGVLEQACREQHRGFATVCALGRPFVMLKLASSLDGQIAIGSGESRWITGPDARAKGHLLRSRVDAIAVGSGTALADDPELTARRGGRVIHRPIRVLVDSNLRVPPDAKLYREGADRTWVLCGSTAGARRRKVLEGLGVRLLEVPTRAGVLDLKRALARLAREGLTEVLVEGGGNLAAALLRARLVDELHWFVAPRLLGGDGRPSVGDLGLRSLVESPQLEPRVGRVGDDLYIRGPVAYPASSGGRARSRGANP
ncbi:MAG: bifunctional diaminohydroxyphosphoribosylaminopyrimidine deaminase/5-amino-6-(5-phosphoribosylamino)uracil reductase RibD [Deltaproteobacteria bacterium]|jgi:diaminohydroxyphosphoribosylaminopyrimidine deaminase/5-amino-6-(5-phosphoribosylamino)uracil reductase|nr:bifunctional diaminohydroxyphosphoribosylaminopyrimidine deaminase/5-amino-6-(5-phosphoribosylamino)uracil reductase RibD [Deltaproteobacteria bacterium]